MAMADRVRKKWTVEELHSLPDDGNTYELVHGELFVTPAPTLLHETVLARLTRILDPYVAANDLGYVYRPRAVIMVGDDTEVEPDFMVRQPPEGRERRLGECADADPRGRGHLRQHAAPRSSAQAGALRGDRDSRVLDRRWSRSDGADHTARSFGRHRHRVNELDPVSADKPRVIALSDVFGPGTAGASVGDR